MIVIAGMHRSGTSMVANLLHDVGLPFGNPDDRYATDRWNAKGYFEQVDVIDLNSRLLTGLRRAGSRIEALCATARYALGPDSSTIASRARRYEADLLRLSEKYAALTVKDPRFCLTLRHWRETVSVSHLVVCLRDPLAVAHSLRRRQRFPLALGLRFFEYHIRNLLEQIDGMNTLFLDYDRLSGVEAVEELRRLRAFFALDISEADLRSRHRDVFDPKLRHFQATDPDALPDSVREVWKELRRRHGAMSGLGG